MPEERVFFVDRDLLFLSYPKGPIQLVHPIEWSPQPWRRSEDRVIAMFVDEARKDLQASLEHSLDMTCIELGLDAYTTWRWPHNDEIDRARYKMLLEWRAEQMIALQVIHPNDYARVTAVPF